jgi:hypothetical protein
LRMCRNEVATFDLMQKHPFTNSNVILHFRHFILNFRKILKLLLLRNFDSYDNIGMARTVCLVPEVKIGKQLCNYCYVIYTTEQLKIIPTKPSDSGRGHLLPEPLYVRYNAGTSNQHGRGDSC